MEGTGSAPAPTAQDGEQKGTVTPWATPDGTRVGSAGQDRRLLAMPTHGGVADRPRTMPLQRDALWDLKSKMAQRGAADQLNP